MTMYTTLDTRFRHPLSLTRVQIDFQCLFGFPIKVMSDMTKYGIKD